MMFYLYFKVNLLLMGPWKEKDDNFLYAKSVFDQKSIGLNWTKSIGVGLVWFGYIIKTKPIISHYKKTDWFGSDDISHQNQPIQTIKTPTLWLLIRSYCDNIMKQVSESFAFAFLAMDMLRLES